VRGTGQRHRVRRWEQSQLTNKPHKLVIPAAHANKKFVLLVGDSHLRALVDGFVAMPEGPLSFGFMSTPGATAAHLRTELVAAVVPRQPDAVVVLAPSNNLTACRGLEDSSADFAALVKSARSRWSNVVVLDFPPRLSVAEAEQRLLRMAYHSVCVEQGVPFHHIAENFPLRQRDLWARDGTHLSDNVGMPILAYLLWQAADRQLAEPEPEPPVSAVPACPYRPRFATQVVVSGHEPQPRPAANPDGWVTVVRGQKRSLPEAELAALDAQVVQKKVVLKECFIPLTPVRFSPTLLRAVEKTSPSFLPSPEVETAVPVHIQMDTDVEVVSVVTPTSAVSTPVMDEFVLLVGDSHLRALVDGFVAMPEGPLSFGFMSTPGATAAHLRTELVAAVVPRQPDAVVVLAPSNNLTACRGLEDSSADFAALVKSARSRWSNMDTDVEVVSVVTPTSAVSTPVMDENEATHHAVDLTSEPGLSVPLPVRGGDEFVLLVGDSHLRALVDGFVAMPEGPLSFGFMSTPGATAAHLRTELVAAVVPRQPDAVVVLAPSNNLTACRGLEDSSADFAALVKSARSRWSNTHLSDNVGMPILAYLLWQAADRQLAEPEPEPEPPVSAVPACPYRPRFATQVVVSGHEPQPRPAANPDGWVTVVRGQKRSLPEAELAALDAQVVQKKVVLKECFIPLTPVRFSPTLLRAVEKTSPSFLPSPEVETAVPVHIQVDTAVSEVAKPVNALPVAEKMDTDVEVVSVVTPTSAVSTPVMDE
ncbi:hypothetical protein GBF38_004874, partial [Nibea albiflora]